MKLHKILEEDPNADQAEAVRRASKLIDEAESEGKSPPEANPYTSVVALAVELNQHLYFPNPNFPITPASTSPSKLTSKYRNRIGSPGAK